jgi:diguanylate cyclase (GGDEF)-like protein/PAS domain S-box-containing protein
MLATGLVLAVALIFITFLTEKVDLWISEQSHIANHITQRLPYIDNSEQIWTIPNKPSFVPDRPDCGESVAAGGGAEAGASFPADQRARQDRRGLILLGVRIVCLAGLVVFGLRRERVARRGRDRLHSILSGVRDIVVVVGTDRAMTCVGPAVRDLLGHDPDCWIGRPLTDFAHAADVERIQRLCVGPGGGTVLNVRLTTASGDLRWFDLEARDLTGHPELAGVLVTCHETGERKAIQDQLSYQASHDPLTGIPNRTRFVSELEAAIGTARSGGPSFALLFIDLDRFKPVNDSLGHDAGDEVLRTVARRLAQTLREGDLAARLSGDEFGILLAGTDGESAGMVADRVIEAISAPITVGTSAVRVGVSIGVAVSTLSLETPEHFLSVADEAMYEAKRMGTGRCVAAATTRSGLPPVASRPRVPVTDLMGGSCPPTRCHPAQGNVDGPVAGSAWPGPSGHSSQRRVDRLMTPLVSGSVLLVMAAASLLLETPARHSAEHQRIAGRMGLTAMLADFFSTRITDPQHLIEFALVAVAVLGLAVVNGRREAAVRRDERRLHALIHNMQGIVVVTGVDGRITFVSSPVAVLLGHRVRSCAGRRLPDAAHADDAAAIAAFLRRATETGTATVRNIRLRTFDHTYRWFDIEASDLRDRPEVAGILLTCHEIGERRALEDQLSHRCRHDALTGLPNRAAFIQCLEGITKEGMTSAFAVLFIDLDRFKPLNDTYGHDVGDEVLRIIGARLGGVSGKDDLVYRLGGDEFAVVVRNADDTRARAVADRLLDTIRRPISVDRMPVRVDATIGIAVVGPDDTHPDTVVHKADLAMYRTKKAGYVHHVVGTPTPEAGPVSVTLGAAGTPGTPRTPSGPADGSTVRDEPGIFQLSQRSPGVYQPPPDRETVSRRLRQGPLT